MGLLATHLHLGVRGTVRVELQRDVLLPGDTLVGSVVLRITKPIDAATLTVRVRGRQTLDWTTSSGDAMVAHAKTVDHLLETTLLTREDIAFTVGDSEYAFTFYLPDDLQHTFDYKCKRVEELQGVHVGVTYDVEATLAVRGLGMSNLMDKVSFRVIALPMAVPFGRRVSAAREDTVRFLALFKRGSCHVGLRLATDILDAMSTIDASVTLQLKTPHPLKYIELVLYEDVYVNCHNALFPGRKRGTRARCSRRFDRTTIRTTAVTNSDGTLSLNLQLPITTGLAKDDVLHPTMTSFFIHVAYRVAVEAKFPMAPHIRVHAPVTVIPRLVAPRELQVTAVT